MRIAVPADSAPYLDPSRCPVPWCDERADHAGEHTHYVGSLGLRDTRDRPITISIVQVRTTGNRTHRRVEIVVNAGSTVVIHASKTDLDKFRTMLTAATKN